MQFGKPIVYGGANRRCDREVIEIRVEVSDEELGLLRTSLPTILGEISQLLPTPPLPQHFPMLTSADALCALIAELGLGLQQAGGHEVSSGGVAHNAAGDRHFAWFEYEERTTGETACALLTQLIQSALLQDRHQSTSELKVRLQEFLREAKDCAVPADTWAMIRAARARGIPLLRMDRPPFEPISGKFRIRPHGLLRLGHGHRQETVDGSFCVSRSETLYPLIDRREQTLAQISALGIPNVTSTSRWCSGAVQAARQAERLGYPVRLTSASRSIPDVAALTSREQVREAAQGLLQRGADAVLPLCESGSEHRLVLCSGQRIAFTLSLIRDFAGSDPKRYRAAQKDEQLDLLAQRIAEHFSTGMLAIHFAKYGHSSDASQWQVMDVELAPELGRYLRPGPEMEAMAAAFIDWLYPDPRRARIPIVAVTGTNGKTTTAGLLECILSAANNCTGLASSVGSRIGGVALSHDEEAYALGHIKVLNDPRVEMAVLESTRAAAAGAGLGFSRCTVAVCLNVTEDHLDDDLETNTLADLALAKRSIVNMAQEAVVLNADDERCREMAPALSNRQIAWATLANPATLALEGEVCAGLIEHDGQQWLALQQGQHQLPILPVEAVPITVYGRAQHNISNALHAMLAAHLLGVDTSVIAQGLVAFRHDFERTPGRLNAVAGFPFTLYLDYAHNPAGVASIAAFAAATPVRGRRILCFSCSNQNSDQMIRDTAASAAGFFDLYVCKNFGNLFGRQPEEGPQLLRQGLLGGGVAASQILCVNEELAAIDAALALAQPGDFVMIIGGKRHELIGDHLKQRAKAYAAQCDPQSPHSAGHGTTSARIM